MSKIRRRKSTKSSDRTCQTNSEKQNWLPVLKDPALRKLMKLKVLNMMKRMTKRMLKMMKRTMKRSKRSKWAKIERKRRIGMLGKKAMKGTT